MPPRCEGVRVLNRLRWARQVVVTGLSFLVFLTGGLALAYAVIPARAGLQRVRGRDESRDERERAVQRHVAVRGGGGVHLARAAARRVGLHVVQPRARVVDRRGHAPRRSRPSPPGVARELSLRTLLHQQLPHGRGLDLLTADGLPREHQRQVGRLALQPVDTFFAFL